MVQELERRGWVNKRWQTRKGRHARRPAVHQDQPAPPADQRRLRRQGPLQGRGPPRRAAGPRRRRRLPARAGSCCAATARRSAPPARNRFGGAAQGAAALRAVRLRHDAGARGQGRRGATATTPASRAQKRGWHTCPSKSIPAAEIEQLVVEQVQEVGRDPALLHERAGAGAAAGTRGGRRSWRRRGAAWSTTWRAGRASCTCCPASCGPARTTARWSPGWPSCRSGSRLVAGRVQKVRAQIRAVHDGLLDEDQAATALALFDPLWETLTPGEQARVLGLLVAARGLRRGAGQGVDHLPPRRHPGAGRRVGRPSRRDAAHDDDVDDRA